MGTTYRNNLEGLPWEKRLPLLHETIFLLSNRPFLHVCASVWHRKIRQFWSIKEEVLPYWRYVARVYLIPWTLFERCKTTANDIRSTEKLNLPLHVALNLQCPPAYTKQNESDQGRTRNFSKLTLWTTWNQGRATKSSDLNFRTFPMVSGIKTFSFFSEIFWKDDALTLALLYTRVKIIGKRCH